jgi:sterol desaturase/sphingolipid hydroxylase (fatty acid hydroxylase superfamily)
MSAIEKLEQRLTALEAEVAKLKQQNGANHDDNRPWWDKIAGTFANDPYYDEAMRLGRKYRESTRPKSRKKKKKAKQDS